MARGNRPTPEFSREAVRLAPTSGRNRKGIAEDLGVGLSSLMRWIARYRDEEAPPEVTDDLEAELRRLRMENAILKQERDILRKSRGLLREGGKSMSFAFIHSPAGDTQHRREGMPRRSDSRSPKCAACPA